MNSVTTKRFGSLYAGLPAVARKQAREAYKQFRRNPYHPGLHFKQVHSTRPLFSVRITQDYRAVGILQDNSIIWFWIGSHADYDRLLNQLGKQ